MADRKSAEREEYRMLTTEPDHDTVSKRGRLRMWPGFLRAGPLAVLALFATGSAVSAQEERDGWRDSVAYDLPEAPATKGRVTRAAEWLTRHTVTVSRPADGRSIRVIAWKDPTLAPDEPKLLAGYVITDTLWAAKALKPFDSEAASEIERGLRQLGWYGNGLHDVLFHPVDRMLHRSADQDMIHGHSLGRFSIAGGRSVDLRVFRQKWDADYEVGHPLLFAEHAAYQGICDFWKGRKEEARRRIVGIVRDDRSTSPQDHVFWDRQAGILVDYVNREDWPRFERGEIPTCRHYSFKLGVLLYAIRLLGMEEDIGPSLEAMKRRLWSAQADDGGVAHFIDVRRDGVATPGRLNATGEASAIAILAETVRRGK
jgi:hypothetical protein